MSTNDHQSITNVNGESFNNALPTDALMVNPPSANPRLSSEFNAVNITNNDVPLEALIKKRNGHSASTESSQKSATSEATVGVSSSLTSSIGIIASLTVTTVAVAIGVTSIVVPTFDISTTVNTLEATAHEVYYDLDMGGIDTYQDSGLDMNICLVRNGTTLQSTPLKDGENKGSFADLTINTSYRVSVIGDYGGSQKTYYSQNVFTKPITKFNRIDSDFTLNTVDSTFSLSLDYYDDFNYYSSFLLSLTDASNVSYDYSMDATREKQTFSYSHYDEVSGETITLNLTSYCVMLSLSVTTSDPEVSSGNITFDNRDIIKLDDPNRLYEEVEGVYKVWFIDEVGSQLTDFTCDWNITESKKMMLYLTYEDEHGYWYNPRLYVTDHNGKETDFDFSVSTSGWGVLDVSWLVNSEEESGAGLDLFTGVSTVRFGFFTNNPYEQFLSSLKEPMSDGFITLFSKSAVFKQASISQFYAASYTTDLENGTFHLQLYYFDENNYYSLPQINLVCGEETFTYPLEMTTDEQTLTLEEDITTKLWQAKPENNQIKILLETTQSGKKATMTAYQVKGIDFIETPFFKNVDLNGYLLENYHLVLTMDYRGDPSLWLDLKLSLWQGSYEFVVEDFLATKERQSLDVSVATITWSSPVSLFCNHTFYYSDGGSTLVSIFSEENVTFTLA